MRKVKFFSVMVVVLSLVFFFANSAIAQTDYVAQIQGIYEKYQPLINKGMKTKDETGREKSRDAYQEMHAKMKDVAKKLLAKKGISLEPGQMVEVFPHNDGSVSVVVANQKYPGTEQADCYNNTKWHEFK